MINEPGNACFREPWLSSKDCRRSQGIHPLKVINDCQSLIKRSAMKSPSLGLLAFLGACMIVSTAVATTNDFALECVRCKDGLACALRNVSTKAIRYSSYTIGYHEAIGLERYDSASQAWLPVRAATNRVFGVKSFGASPGDVRTVNPGAVVPPEGTGRLRVEIPGTFSFVLRLADYELPRGEALVLRVTQTMGTLLGSDLDVWKGRVVSDPVKCEPNPRGGANGGQPAHPATNRTNAAAAPRRSP